MEAEPNPEGLLSQAKQIIATGLAAIQNRGELFLLELEEEKSHLIELLVWAMAVGLLGARDEFGAVDGADHLVVPSGKEGLCHCRGYACCIFAGAVLAWLNLRGLLKYTPPPFSGTINEIKKDSACLDSSK